MLLLKMLVAKKRIPAITKIKIGKSKISTWEVTREKEEEWYYYRSWRSSDTRRSCHAGSITNIYIPRNKKNNNNNDDINKITMITFNPMD